MNTPESMPGYITALIAFLDDAATGRRPIRLGAQRLVAEVCRDVLCDLAGVERPRPPVFRTAGLDEIVDRCDAGFRGMVFMDRLRLEIEEAERARFAAAKKERGIV